MKKQKRTKAVKARRTAKASTKIIKSQRSRNKKLNFTNNPTNRGLKKAPRNSSDLSKLSEAAREAWNRIAQVPSLMKSRKISLTQASKELAVDRHAVVTVAGSAFRKLKSGKYVAKASDRLLRILVVPSLEGLREVVVRGSGPASVIAEYSDAVQRFLRTGDKSRLEKFANLEIKDADGKPIQLLVDVTELRRLGSAGVLSFESLYARTA